MIDHYRTVKGLGRAEVVIRKSRFIGHAKAVDSEAEAVAFIEQIKQEHHSATHNCSAYMVGERDEFQKQSDDGEPSGTAGRPILEVLKNKQLKNVVVVVTRYFGGIMLGAGGLIRAYTEAAVVGIEAAEPIYQVLHSKVKVAIDYTWLGKVENELRNREIWMGDTEFADKVILECLPLQLEFESFIQWITNLTQGQAKITHVSDLYMMHQSLDF